MSDPNADLIGAAIEYGDQGAIYLVEKTVEWSNEYVAGCLIYDGGSVQENIIKPAAVVRRRKEMDNA